MIGRPCRQALMVQAATLAACNCDVADGYGPTSGRILADFTKFNSTVRGHRQLMSFGLDRTIIGSLFDMFVLMR